MARGHRQPKKNLRFSVLLEVLQDAFNRIPDQRNPQKINYQINDIYTAAFAMFFFQDKSLLEFQKQMENRYRLCILATVFGISKIPEDSQLRDVIDIHSYETILAIFKDYFLRLQRGKYLDRFQFPGSRYLVTLDGSEYYSSKKLECEKCLTKENKDGTITFLHQILQATIVHPDMKYIFVKPI